MTFSNPVDSSNVHFQQTSGLFEVAKKLRAYPDGTTLNLGFSTSGGTFTVHAYDGSALSASNPAWIILQSKASPGRSVIFEITANQTFIDDAGASTIIGNLFGLTTGIAYAQDLPFFLYAVSNDAEDSVSFMISRIPHRHVAPAAGNIGKTGSAVASTQGSFFALGNPTVGDYDGNPCAVIGSFRMRMSALDDWTVQTLDEQDGIGKWSDGRVFTQAAGQFGAEAGKYFQDNGGTAPGWTSQSVNFKIMRSGHVVFSTNMSTTSSGAGAVEAKLCIPYVCHASMTNAGAWKKGDALGMCLPNRTSPDALQLTYTNAGAFGIANNADLLLDMDVGIVYPISAS